MKILVIHNTYQQSGGEDVVAEAEVLMLRNAGHQVVMYHRSNNEINNFEWQEKIIFPKQVIWAKKAIHDLRGIIYKEKPDAAHFHNTFLMISPAAYYACQEAGVPVVQTLHNYRLLCPAATFFREGRVCEDCLGHTLPWPGVLHACYRGSRAETALVASMLTFHHQAGTWQKKVDVYIALTEFARRKFIEGGLPPEKIVVKPNFLNQDPGIGESEREYAVFVGRLSTEKGLRTLLKAWLTLKEIPLKIIGDGPMTDEIKMFVKTNQLENSINILGRCSRQEVYAQIKGSRFLVFPSEWYEGFPITILEVFACGKPVIASQLGAMAEIIKDGKTGLFFEVGNSGDLASKVRQLLKNPQAYAEMGKNARVEFETKYTAEKNYEMLMRIYEKAIASAKGKSSG